MRRLVIPDAETFAAAVEDEIDDTPQGRYYHRLHVVLLVLRGYSCYEAARVYGDSPRSVQYWMHRLTSHGLAGLKEGDRPGRPSRLSQSEKDRLREELKASPRALGYDQNLWDGKLLSHHLEVRYGVELGVRQCQRLFHELGFTLQRPRQQAQEADPLQQEAFKKTTTGG
ncbi:MAG: transposase [Clostridia bacterium]|nr:transposase [Clostridia bacterium]